MVGRMNGECVAVESCTLEKRNKIFLRLDIRLCFSISIVVHSSPCCWTNGANYLVRIVDLNMRDTDMQCHHNTRGHFQLLQLDSQGTWLAG
jgi:hypothetical protein